MFSSIYRLWMMTKVPEAAIRPVVRLEWQKIVAANGVSYEV